MKWKLNKKALRGGFARPNSSLRSHPGFLYHGTSADAVLSIAKRGLKTHRPWHGTAQHSWPDGSRQRRSYFSPKASTTAFFGDGAVLRVARKAAKARSERGTGDHYATARIAARRLQVLGADNRWRRLWTRHRTALQRATSRKNLVKARAARRRR